LKRQRHTLWAYGALKRQRHTQIAQIPQMNAENHYDLESLGRLAS
jgi:hypothetical protein